MNTRPKTHPPSAQVIANAVAAEALMPSLAEQFSALDVGVQSRLFRVLDLVGGMSHEEKLEARVLANGCRGLNGVSVEFADLMAAVDGLVFFVDRLATPAADRPESLADRFLDDYAVDHEREG